ncbi:MAG: sensor histidine kinase [Agarilytica sp.]
MSSYNMPALFSPNGNKLNYVSLLFSLFYFLPLFFMAERLSAWQWASIVIAYISFLLLYFWGLKSDSRRALLPIFAILALCCAVTFITPGSNALFGFATFLGGYYFSLKRAIVVLVFALGLESVTFLWVDHDVVFLGIALFLSAALFINAIFLRKDLQHRFTEKRDQSRIQELATIAERERISRDLHDLLGHSLSSIALKAELAEKFINTKAHESAAKEVADVAALARSTLKDVRESVSGLRQKGLYAELNKLCQQLQSAGFDTQCEDELSECHSLSADIESTIILLLKGACTNILRHSKGDSVRIELKKDSSAFMIMVWDNGGSSQLEIGNGIRGMKDRCHSMGGQLTLESDDEGTQLKMTIPGTEHD